ncbi:MAG: alpha/beta hydrolase [Desulfobacterales bacterium]|jgi:alpha/beta superfamily hydrolase
METEIHFTSMNNRLEGRLRQSGLRAVVITHPHSLYGGNMHSPVVEAIAGVYQMQGYTTLRFNFRGVAGSQGNYGEGIGEQEDVRQAMAFMEREGFGPIELSGYSFGAWVNAHGVVGHRLHTTMTMVSPPTAFMDFRAVEHLPGLVLAITGGRDDLAPPDMLRRMILLWNPQAHLEVLPGADHFFLDHLDALTAALAQALANHHPMSAAD